jgi:hypothetical protein
VCVRNSPLLSLGTLVRARALRIFDKQVVSVRRADGGSLAAAVEYHAASEDSSLQGALSGRTAEAQAGAAFLSAGDSSFWWATQLWQRFSGALNITGGARGEYTATFSPFHTSCVGLRPTAGNVTIVVEWFHDGPVASLDFVSEHGIDSVRQWGGPALVAAGLLLFAYAPALAESVAFHYASGVSIAMLVSVLLLVLFVWHRTGRRKPFLTFTALLSAAGCSASAAYAGATPPPRAAGAADSAARGGRRSQVLVGLNLP